MTDNNAEDSEDQKKADFMPPPPPPALRKIKKLDAKVAKTVLDTDACRSVVASSQTVKELKLQEKIESKTTEQPKPFQALEKYCQAAPCASPWDPNATTKKFQICNRCQLHVYDFTKMDVKEIENLVFSREGKENPKFFRRQDGKFLTADCPMGKGRRNQMYMLVGIAACLLFGLIVLSTSAPPPAQSPTSQGPSVVVTDSRKSKSQESNLTSKAASSNSMPKPTIEQGATRYKRDYDPTAIYQKEAITK